MDFSFTEEQTMLRDSVRRFVSEAYDFEGYRKIAASEAGYSPDIWQQLGELQWQALPFSEADGGHGYGPVELLLLMEEMGRGLCIEPYLPNVVLAGQLIAALGSDAQKSSLLPGLFDGSKQYSLAHAELQGRFNPAHCETSAEKSADGYVLNGTKSLVLNGPNADSFLVLARSTGSSADPHGLSLFIVPADTAGLEQRGYAVLGGGSACELKLNNVQLSAEALLGQEGQAFPALEDVLDLATVASCAEAYGAMQAMLEKTVEYLKTRKQFGVPLASLQVLQHRMVDMYIEVQQSQSMILMAMLRFSEGNTLEKQRAASACKAYLHKASKFVAQQAVQLHGGIGVTEELDIGHYFRRLTAFGTLFGDRDYHLRRFARLEKAAQAQANPSITQAA